MVLRSADVAWGETIDGRLEFSARDGSGTAYIDELEEYSFTRPTREDCEAVTAPTEAEPAPAAAAPGAPDAGQGPSGAATPTPSPSAAPRPSGSADPAAGPGGSGSGTPVSAGGSVTLQASGFLPGELVTIQLNGSDDVLGTATAGADGIVQVEVRIPGRTSSGAATVELFGTESQLVTPVQLEVARAETPVTDDRLGDLVPLTAAAAALVATVAGLVSVAGRQRSVRRQHTPFRHA